jgi:predicted nucleotidyltransferase component of viral defense system
MENWLLAGAYLFLHICKFKNMIHKREILQIATDTGLSAPVIEKDYVLGWLLAGIYQHEVFRSNWVFKGGTCLKKCYFETYRFSEDLDFTLKEASHLNETFLKNEFSQISEWIYEVAGIEIPAERMMFELFENPRGKIACQGRIFYRGPVSSSAPRQFPRIKLDLTVDELIAEPPVINLVNHVYSDLPEQKIQAHCYSYAEVFAEKIRALSERTRPRDLYDVINFYRRPESREIALQIRDILSKKCDFKKILFPSFVSLQAHKESCRAGWNDQLAHQMQALPPFESFWNELPVFFDWLEKPNIQPTTLPTSPGLSIEAISFRELNNQLQHSIFDRIRFSAANHVCVEIKYIRDDGQRNTYLIEPYSLRKDSSNRLLLFGLKHPKREIRQFRTDKILSAKITSQTFIPLYQIEFLPIGNISK